MDPNLNAAVYHLKRNIKNIFNKHSQHAYKLSLTLPGAFSNKLNHFVLVDRDGAADVYLPNETHWGSLGHQIVARALQEYLKRMGVLAPTP